jgi:nitroreductase
MNVSDAIRNRRSIRTYQEGFVIPDEEIHMILEAAMMAPSARNTRPWEFFVITEPSLKEKMIAAHPYACHLQTASIGIVVCGRPDLQNGTDNDFWPQDCGAAVENILLQALDLGYGSCWCGIHPEKKRVTAFQKILDTHSIPLALVTIGVSKEVPVRRGFYDEKRVTFL